MKERAPGKGGGRGVKSKKTRREREGRADEPRKRPLAVQQKVAEDGRWSVCSTQRRAFLFLSPLPRVSFFPFLPFPPFVSPFPRLYHSLTQARRSPVCTIPRPPRNAWRRRPRCPCPAPSADARRRRSSSKAAWKEWSGFLRAEQCSDSSSLGGRISGPPARWPVLSALQASENSSIQTHSRR